MFRLQPSQSSPQPESRLAKWWPVALIPALTGLLTAVVWSFLPKPTLPAAIEAVNTAVLHKPVANPASSPGPGSANPPVASSGGIPLQSSAPNPPAASAAVTGPGTTTLVALGDSITFGYNLPGAAPGHASPNAYPFLLGQREHLHAVDLGVPGWTSGDLLTALKTAKFHDALKQAGVVTLDIGSNDLLQTTYDLLARSNGDVPDKDAVMNDARYRAALERFAANLPNIVTEIHKQTKAPVVLVNLYDPFPDGSSLHAVGEQAIAAANQVIYQVAATSGLPVADGYAAYNHRQPELVRLSALDIHPTVQGQQELAKAVQTVLHKPLWYQPAYYAVSSTGTLLYAKTLVGPFANAWLGRTEGALVTGLQGGWLQVVTSSGKTAYVRQSQVELLLRPWGNVSFQNTLASAWTGELTDSRSGRTADVFSKDGVVYAPLAYLAQLANAQVSLDPAQHEANVLTPLHSGLVQEGLFSAGSEATAKQQSSARLSVAMRQTGEQWVSLTTAGTLVNIDGEPVNLGVEPVSINNQLYVPADAFWKALGGHVTRDEHGLLQLSADGS